MALENNFLKIIKTLPKLPGRKNRKTKLNSISTSLQDAGGWDFLNNKMY
jgi:hypothetical protein